MFVAQVNLLKTNVGEYENGSGQSRLLILLIQCF